MGIGDWLMVSGEARRRAAGTARRFRVLNKRGEPYWHFVFEGHPNIARPGERFDEDLGFVNGHRSYIAEETKQKRTFREYAPAPAPLHLPRQALQRAARAAGAVVFNPSIKHSASPNKDWGWERWRELVALVKNVRWLQLGEPGARRIPGAEYVETPHFTDAAGLLSGARAAVLHEGALHHAAAALGIPAVVIYGGYIGPRVTGYAGQVALFEGGPEYPLGCGMRVPCSHCAAAMAAITPARVATALVGLLEPVPAC